MNDAKNQVIADIHNYRRHERLLFRQCIEAHGADSQALSHLDHLTNSHRDEERVQKTRSHNKIRSIDHRYPRPDS